MALPDNCLIIKTEVFSYIEGLPDFLRGVPLDCVGYGLTAGGSVAMTES